MQRIKTGKLINPLVEDVLDVLDFNVITYLRSSEEHLHTFLDGFDEFFRLVITAGVSNPI